MKVILIAAVDRNLGLSKDGQIPWRLPKDMEHFKKTTDGHVVIMGRKTWDSLPSKFKPLPGRENIVLTRESIARPVSDGCFYSCNLEETLNFYEERNYKGVFIIGGGEVYKLALPFATDIVLTEVNGKFDCDTFFPKFDFNQWNIASMHFLNKDEKHSHNFTITHFTKA